MPTYNFYNKHNILHYPDVFFLLVLYHFFFCYNSISGLYSPGARVASAQWRIGDALTTGGTTTDQWPPKKGATMCVRRLRHSALAESRLGRLRLRFFWISGAPPGL